MQSDRIHQRSSATIISNLALALGVALTLASTLPTPALGSDLLGLYREARSNDATFASARATLTAGRERLPQGRALVLPTVSATGSTIVTESDITQWPANGRTLNFPRDFRTNAWTVTLNQPLYRPQNLIQYEQAGYQVAQSEAQFAQASQDLILRVAQAYFDVLASENSLAFIRAQKTAISEQLAQAKRNFEVGTATITDTNEAQARFDLSVSQEIAGQNDLELKKQVLQQIIGRIPESLSPLKAQFAVSMPQPNRMEDWVESAKNQSFAVRVQQAVTEIAEREVSRNRAAHYPTLDLVGTFGNNFATSTLNQALNAAVPALSKTSTIGLQLALPIYAGGSVDSRIRESLANLDKARSDLENARRQAALQAQQAFLGVTNGLAQVRALEQAVASSQTALASNQLGYEVGVRINIDVLNAQQQLYSTQRDLAQARYNTIVNGLRLKSAAGSLTEEDVEQVNQLLQ